jgi:hypothetical protein
MDITNAKSDTFFGCEVGGADRHWGLGAMPTPVACQEGVII